MELGYVTFSTTEQQLVHNILQQLQQGSIDELGLGRMRDAFSDQMFPGMSTLHRKSKYFVLLPSLYNQLAKTNITDKKEIPSRIREWEINMTISLLCNTSANGEATEGITGNSISIMSLQKGHFVKIRPTNIYLSALKFYGLVDDKMNLTDLIYQQSRINREASAKGRRTKKELEEDLDDDINMGTQPNFVSFPGYDFSRENSIGLKLTTYEAQILKDKIINKCCRNGIDNLYSYILKNDSIEIKENFFKMKPVVDRFPDKLKKVYDLACEFSKWAHLMNTYYRYAFNMKAGNEAAQQTQKDHLNKIIGNNDYPSKDKIDEIICYVKGLPFFKDVNGLLDFCKKASEYIGDESKEEEFIGFIAGREKRIKGNHYKIGNERYKNTNFADLPGYYSYRWNEIVYSMINDIRNPQP